MNSDNSNEHTYTLNIKERIPEVLKKKSFILLSSLLLIFVFSFTIFSPSHSHQARKMVNKFEKSINNDDIKSLSKLMTTNNSSDNLSESQVSTFKDYLLKNPDTFNELISNLKKEAHYHDTNNADNSYYNKASIAYISKIDDNYKVVVNTSNIIITLPSKNVDDSLLDDVVFSIDGVKCEPEKAAKGSYKINSLMPAKYKITATINNSYFSTEDSKSIDIFKTYQSSTSSSKITLFDDDFKSVQLSTNAESAVLYINNIEVRKFTNGDMLSPITKDMKLYAVVSNNDKTLKSNTVKWNGTAKELSLNFDDYLLSSISENSDEVLQKNITKLLEDYSKNYAKFISNKSYKYISSYISSGSSLESQNKDYINTIKDQKISYKFVSCEVTNINISDDKKEISATVNSVYDKTINNDKSSEAIKFRYKLIYNEKSKKYIILDRN